ncbi:MAG: 3'-5' exonuclease [Spirulinaceae cyanobacterium]
MTRKLDQILVLDIEATCWSGKPPPGQESEIIEIGICPLDVKLSKPLEKASILVKPQCSTVSDFCTELTTLTQEQVDQGISFAEACSILQDKYQSRQQVWASYGEYDRQQFTKQCKSRGVKYPFGTRHINVKTLLALQRRLAKEVGMAQALEILDLPLQGTHHRGVDDAGNIARILAKLLWH